MNQATEITRNDLMSLEQYAENRPTATQKEPPGGIGS
jgi:hypothetical protein